MVASIGPAGREQFNEPAVCSDWRVEHAVDLMRHRVREPLFHRATGRGTWNQLNRAVLDHVGTSPAPFWRNLRLEHTRWRLLNSSRTITEISYECGFSDASHFSRWFKKTYGETPASYRDRRARLYSGGRIRQILDHPLQG
jgi:transcriptional regulator GlxA family with amidase domain